MGKFKIKIKKPKDPKDAVNEAKKKIIEAQKQAQALIDKARRDAIAHKKLVDAKVKEKINKIKLNASELPFKTLAPFKKVMANVLTRSQISHNDNLKDIVLKFAHFIVDARNTRPSQTNYFNGSLYVTPSQNAIEEQMYNAETAEYTQEGTEAAKYEKGAKETKNIVMKIIAWFKDRKAKKKAGKELDPAESAAIDEADGVSENLLNDAEKEVNEDAGVLGSGFSIVQILIATVLVALGLKLAFGKKEKA